MDENETSNEAPEITVNMYPSVKEQVAATALVSVVSIAIPLAALGILAGVGSAVTKVRDWRETRKARKDAKVQIFTEPAETE